MFKLRWYENKSDGYMYFISFVKIRRCNDINDNIACLVGVIFKRSDVTVIELDNGPLTIFKTGENRHFQMTMTR